jgi:hypothetical protein
MAMNGTTLGQELAALIPTNGLTPDEIQSITDAWTKVGETAVSHIQNNAELDQAKLDTSIKGVISSGIPVPQDGGATLQSTWSAALPAEDSVSGGVK